MFFNDLLQVLPSSSAYDDDYILFYSYEKKALDAVITRVNDQLGRIAAWEEQWQVKFVVEKTQQVMFAAEKTQCMAMSRSPKDSQMIHGRMPLNGGTLDIDDHLNILGVELTVGCFFPVMSITWHTKHRRRLVLLRMKQLLEKRIVCAV